MVNASTFARDVPNVFQEEETYVDLVVCQDMASFYRNLKNGACNVLAGDQFEVATRTVRDAGYVSDYQIGNNVFSKEPLALVTRANDSSWSDFVNWVVQSMLTAEEQNITQSDGSSINETFVFGDRFKNMFSNAVTEVGHYGELYESRLQAIVSRKAVNNINSGMTGLLYAMPFGNLESKGPAPGSKSKLEEIRFRGALNCGVEEITGFYTFNTTTETKSGFDVDICWALSAAIFGAAGNMVNFVRTTSTSRFVDLNIHRVDVLSRYTTVNLERDVWEPSANTGFTFSQPTFYDSVGFGGIPP